MQFISQNPSNQSIFPGFDIFSFRFTCWYS